MNAQRPMYITQTPINPHGYFAFLCTGMKRVPVKVTESTTPNFDKTKAAKTSEGKAVKSLLESLGYKRQRTKIEYTFVKCGYIFGANPGIRNVCPSCKTDHGILVETNIIPAADTSNKQAPAIINKAPPKKRGKRN